MEKHAKPTIYESPRCACCGRAGQERRMGWCFDCADLQAMLIDGEDMYDNDYSDWNKSEVLAYIVRQAMSYAIPQTKKENDK